MNLPWELAGCVKTLSRFSQQKQERMDGSVFFHQKTFPQGHQLNIGVPGSSPVFFNRMFPMWGLRPKKRFWGGQHTKSSHKWKPHLAVEDTT